MAHATSISDRLAEIDFHNRYSLGQKEFTQAKLTNLNISNKTLSGLNLIQANLDRSNLENASIQESDLSKSSSIEVNFKKSKIDNVNFALADLTSSKLSRSKITEVSFLGTCLTKTSFYGAELSKINFSFANLSSAHLARIELENSMFNEAIYNSNTVFPDDFNPADAGMIHESDAFTLEFVTAQFDKIYHRAKKCLGEKITTKYFNTSRPQNDWLDTLKTDSNSKVVFKGDTIKSLDSLEAKYLREWMLAFIGSCAKVVDSKYLVSDL